jgi:ATP-dependent Clp protease ATP-binding subunit ClpB
MEKHSVARLIGAPPGYVGYDEGGQLTTAVKRKPYSVVLFDEIEKAHPDVFNSLLQVLDDGRLTDNQGHTVDFRNTLVIMTSNIGSTLMLENINADGVFAEGTKEGVLEILHRHFRPEFLNRVDEIVLFTPLSIQQIGKIVHVQLDRLRARLHARSIELELDDAALRHIAEAAYDPVYGARPLKRYLQNAVETPLAKKIIAGDIADGEKVLIRCENENLVFTARSADDA